MYRRKQNKSLSKVDSLMKAPNFKLSIPKSKMLVRGVDINQKQANLSESFRKFNNTIHEMNKEKVQKERRTRNRSQPN